MSRCLTAAGLIAALALFGCPSTTTEGVKATIGSAGGTLEHPSGARLIVPPGALTSNVELSITPKAAPEAATIGATPVGGAFILGPEGQQFAMPVQVVVPYDPALLPAGVSASSLEVRISPQSTPAFTALPTTVDASARKLTAATTHFSVVIATAPTGAAQACGTLINGATAISEQQTAATAPTAQGGTIATGIYFLTETVIFTGAGGASGPTGKQRRQTLKVLATGATDYSLEIAETDFTNNSERVSAGVVTINGPTLTLTRTCPSPDSDTVGFSSANDELLIVDSNGTTTTVHRFARQASLDAGTSDGGIAGACASVQRTGPTTGEYQVASAAPTPTGGAIESGTFVRMGALVYTGTGGATGPTGTPRQQSLGVVATSATTGLLEDNTRRTTDTADQLRAYSFAVSGAQLSLSPTCPATGSQALSLGYTMANGQLDVHEPVTGGTRVTTFMKLLADGGIPTWDAGIAFPMDAGVSVDGGSPDAGANPWSVVGTGLSDLVDLDVDATDVYTLGGGEVRRCAQSGCGTTPTLVIGAYASSLLVDNGLLWLATDFRNLKTCAVSGACSLALQTDVGANSYPAHLWAANNRVYWIWESGGSRRISVCPTGGCTTGYPKVVYQGTELDGVAISGLVVTATDAYVSSFTGGIYRLPLSSPEVAGAATMTVATGYGTGGLDVDTTTIRWANIVSGDLESCALPACSTVVKLFQGLGQPAAVRTTATDLFGISRGNLTAPNTWQPGTASIYRTAK